MGCVDVLVLGFVRVCRRRYRLFAIALVLLSTAELSFAQRPVARRTVVVLFDGLTLDDLVDPRMPSLQQIVRESSIGLMNTAVAGPKTDTAAMLTLSLGYQAPAETTDEESYQVGREIVEGDDAGIVYRRRTGLDPLHGGVIKPDSVVVHLGIAPLRRRGLVNALAECISNRHAAALPAVAVYGNADTDKPGRRVALLGIDRDGAAAGAVTRGMLTLDAAAPFGVRDNVYRLFMKAATSKEAVAIVHLGDGARVEHARRRLSISQYLTARYRALQTLDSFIRLLRKYPSELDARILILSPSPHPKENGEWDRLAPLLIYDPYRKSSDEMPTSQTTRTPGIIANVDIAPTMLSWLDAPIPDQVLGHPVAYSADHIGYRPRPRWFIPLDEARRMDRTITANVRAVMPLFGSLAFVAAVVIAGGLLSLYRGNGRAKPFAFALLCLMNMPLALLLAAAAWPKSILELGIWTTVSMLAGGMCQWWLGKRFGTGPFWLAIMTAAVIVADAFCGQWLGKFSLFSAYLPQGFRFYGIGNEYMGVLVGVALLVVFLPLDRLDSLSKEKMVGIGQLAWPLALFALIALVLGWPTLGADAGGFIGAAVAFGCAWSILRGRRASWPAAAGMTGVAVAGAFGLAYLDWRMSGPGASHAGAAIGGSAHRGVGYLADIAWRKVLMNGRILTNPYMLMGIAGVAAIWVTARARFRSHMEEVVTAHPGWARGLPAVGWGAAATFVFNDSGIVAAIFLFGAFFITGIYFAFADPVASANAAPKS